VTLRIEQDSRPKDEGYPGFALAWDWWAWIEGTTAELDKVDQVMWILHPTFPNPIRTTADRGSNFTLKTSGWGVFVLKAKVFLKSGATRQLEHLISFAPQRKSRATGKQTASERETTRGLDKLAVFYPPEDADLGALVMENLRGLAIEPLDPTATDTPLAMTVGHADGVVLVSRDKAGSRIMTSGRAIATELGKPVLSLTGVGDMSESKLLLRLSRFTRTA